MANGSQQPSVYEKIFGQSSLISRLSLDILHNMNYNLTTRTGGHVNVGFLQSPYQKLTCLQSTSTSLSHVSLPLSPFFMKAHSEKGANSLAFTITKLCVFGVGVGITAPFILPFSRVHLLLQNQKEMLKTGRLSEPYNGIYDCFSRTIKNEGFLSLWRGSTAFLIGCFVAQGTTLAFKDYLLKDSNKDKDSYWYNRFAKNLANDLTSLLFTYSLSYAYTRLATDVKASTKVGCGNNSSLGLGFTLDSAKIINPTKGEGERQFNGLIDVYKKTLQSDGIAGVYRGFNIACVGSIVFSGLYFGMVNHFAFKPFVFKDGSFQVNRYDMTSSFCGVLGIGLICYPFGTVSRRMMMTSGESVKYRNSWEAFSQIVKYERPKALFKGAGTMLLPLFPIFIAFNALCGQIESFYKGR